MVTREANVDDWNWARFALILFCWSKSARDWCGLEQVLRGAGEVAWAPGLGDAARPAAARLRQALLGWTRTEPVPASEASSHATCRLGDRRQTRERSWRGEWRRRPSRLHAPPWEVEDGPTGDAQQAIAGFKERLDRRVTGKAWQRSERRAHRKVREAAGGAHDRQRRSGGGVTVGGATSGEPVGGDDGSDQRRRASHSATCGVVVE